MLLVPGGALEPRDGHVPRGEEPGGARRGVHTQEEVREHAIHRGGPEQGYAGRCAGDGEDGARTACDGPGGLHVHEHGMARRGRQKAQWKLSRESTKKWQLLVSWVTYHIVAL